MAEIVMPSWTPAFAAFSALRHQYTAHNIYDDENCWRAANDTVLRRLETGQLQGRAAKASIKWDDPFNDLGPLSPNADGTYNVPTQFWTYFLESRPINRDADWLPGDFSFTLFYIGGQGMDDATCKGSVIGLEVDANALPKVALPGVLDEASPDAVVPRSGGRSPAKWWPDFAEELAWYVHDVGFPEGQLHNGQSAMIEAICERMADAGKAEPSRTTVQPVINALLQRFRSAGN